MKTKLRWSDDVKLKKKKKNSAKYEGWHRSDAGELAKSPYVFLYDFRWSCTHQKTQGYERRCPGMSSCRSPCQGAVHRTDFPLKATWSFLMSLANREEQRQRAALGWEKPGTMFLWWVGKRNRPLSLFTNRWEIIHERGENTRYVHNTHTHTQRNKTRRKDEVWMTLLYLRQGLIWTTGRAGSKLQGVKWRFWLQGGSNWIRAL